MSRTSKHTAEQTAKQNEHRAAAQPADQTTEQNDHRTAAYKTSAKQSAKQNKPLICIAGIVLFAILLILDRISKNMVVANLAGNGEKPLVGDLFVLHYLENTGAAFGILQGKQEAFLAIAIIVLVIIVFIYARMPYRLRFQPLRVIIVGIAAGAIGNMIDRIAQGYVVDFLYIKVIDFPIFNVADIYVTCCCILLIIFLIFVYKDEEFQEMAQAIRPGNKRGDSDAAEQTGEDD